MEGEFGQVVRLGVEVAFTASSTSSPPEPDAATSRQTYVNLGRGEFHAGRSLDALLAAYRVGARLAWRRFVAAGVAGGLAADALYALGEAIFAYIDEISAESAEGSPKSSPSRRRERPAAAAARPPARAGAGAGRRGGPQRGRGGGLAAARGGSRRSCSPPATPARPTRRSSTPLAARFARRLARGPSAPRRAGSPSCCPGPRRARAAGGG